jgi:hypothetical protein
MRRAAVAALAALALAGCGGESGDLIAIEVSGGAQPRPVKLVVTGDGRGSCNGGELQELPSERVIDARETERELEDPAHDSANFGGATRERRGYVARTKDGTVRWREGQVRPEVLGKATLLALQLERDLCRARRSS